MISEEAAGLRSPGRDLELQVEAAVMARVGAKQFLGRKASEKAAARGSVWVGAGVTPRQAFTA